ncbi:COX15/CtaA family protein [Amycolatopsis sp. NPDC021455]|uniref:COX15/CtaA family protein n=1 Tax=Amycolatopsis sp. NPDC021455 TaxID=3154901 RepID=UPI0033F9AA56
MQWPRQVLQRRLAIAALIANAGIAVTGCVVRVTGSGLGCPTWPQCVPGSLTPVAHPEAAPLHQWIEYGNRMLTVVVGLVVAGSVLAAWGARRQSPRPLVLSSVMLGGVVAQAVLGGVTVLTGLSWWTVAAHLLASTALVWLSLLLLDAIDHPASGTRAHPAVAVLFGILVAVLSATLVAGTLVTAAGPHAGSEDTPRLGLPVEPLAHTHASLLFLFLGLLIGLGGVLRLRTPDPRIWRRYLLLVGLVLLQGGLGLVQFLTGVPATLVALHVLGAMVITATTASVWCTVHRTPRVAVGS